MDDHSHDHEMEMSLSTASETQFNGLQNNQWQNTTNANETHQHSTRPAPDMPALTVAELAHLTALLPSSQDPHPSSSGVAVEQQLLNSNNNAGALFIPDSSPNGASTGSTDSANPHRAVTFADFQTQPPMASNSTSDPSLTASPMMQPSELLGQLDPISSQGWHNSARLPSHQLQSTPSGKSTFPAKPVTNQSRAQQSANRPIHMSNIGDFVPSPSRKRKTIDGFPSSDSQESAHIPPIRSSRRKSQPAASRERDHPTSSTTQPSFALPLIQPPLLPSTMTTRIASDRPIAGTQDMLMETSSPPSVDDAIRKASPPRDHAASLFDDSLMMQHDAFSMDSTQSAASIPLTAAFLKSHTPTAETSSTRSIGRGRRSIPGRSIAGSRHGSLAASAIDHAFFPDINDNAAATEQTSAASVAQPANRTTSSSLANTTNEASAAALSSNETTPQVTIAAVPTPQTLAKAQKSRKASSTKASKPKSNASKTKPASTRKASRATKVVSKPEPSTSNTSATPTAPIDRPAANRRSPTNRGLAALPYRRVFVSAGGGKMHFFPGTICAYSSSGFRVVYDDGAYTDIALKNMRKLICPCRIVVGDVVVKDKTVTPKSIRYEVMQSPGAGALARSDIISIRPVKSEDAPSEVKVENAVLVLTKATLRDRQMTDVDFRAFADCACESDDEETVIVTASRTVKRSVSVTETKQTVRPRPRFYRDFDLDDLGSPTKLKSDLLRGFGLVFSKADGPEPTSNVSISQRAHFAGACLLDKVADLFDTSATQQASQHDTTMRFAADDDTSQLSTILLISSEPSTTVKYLEALALGIPCVASQWVTDCCDAGELIDWQLYCLGAGTLPDHKSSVLGLQRFVLNQSAYDLEAISSRQQQLQIFAGRRIVFAHGDSSASQERIGMARHLLTALGATKVLVCSVTMAPSNAELSKYDLIISDHVTKARKQLSNRTVHDWTWMKHCIIAGRILPAAEGVVADDKPINDVAV